MVLCPKRGPAVTLERPEPERPLGVLSVGQVRVPETVDPTGTDPQQAERAGLSEDGGDAPGASGGRGARSVDVQWFIPVRVETSSPLPPAAPPRCSRSPSSQYPPPPASREPRAEAVEPMGCDHSPIAAR